MEERILDKPVLSYEQQVDKLEKDTRLRKSEVVITEGGF